MKNKHAWDELLGRLGRLLPLVPLRWRAVAVAALTLAAAVVAALSVETATQERPAYLATAVMAPVGCDWRTQACVATDANVHVFPGGRVDIEAPTYDRTGHAALPEWRPDLGPLPDGAVPFAPAMGWNVTFMGEVAAGIRPLRYCAQERRVWDVGHPGFDTTGIGIQAVRDVFDDAFDVLASVENCDEPDLVLGANAEVDCGSAGAWGCAALHFRDGGRYVRVTFNGTLLGRGEMPVSAVRAIDWHEYKHAGDLGHTGDYGGEGRAHSHASDLGYICVNGQAAFACDNPSGMATPLDWDDGSGQHRNRYGLRLRGAPPPPPPPSPTPTPTPTPPPAAARQLAVEVWTLRADGCQPGEELWSGWCVWRSAGAQREPGQPALWHWVELHGDGRITWESEWGDVP